MFEMGSAIGYSTIWMARAAGEGAMVYYTDSDPENARRAEKFIERAGNAATGGRGHAGHRGVQPIDLFFRGVVSHHSAGAGWVCGVRKIVIYAPPFVHPASVLTCRTPRPTIELRITDVGEVMPTHLSALKQMRRTQKQTLVNRRNKGVLRTSLRNIRQLLDQGDLEKAQQQMAQAVSRIDRSVQKATIHKNTASRLKSRLAKRLQGLAASKKAQPTQS